MVNAVNVVAVPGNAISGDRPLSLITPSYLRHDPLAKLVPIAASKKERIPDLNEGSVWISDDFDDPLPDEFWLGTA